MDPGGELDHVVAVQPPELGFLAGGFELLRGVLADRLQHAVSRLARDLGVGQDQRLVDQVAEHPQDVLGPQSAARADLLGHVERPPAGEDRQPPQQDPLGLVEQLVAPVDRRPERLLPGRGRSVAHRQQPEPVLDPGVDLLHGQHPAQGGGELDGERHPVERRAEPGDVRRVLLGHGEAPRGGGGTVDEEPHRLAGADVTAFAPGQAERRHPPHGLPCHPQGLAAGREHPHVRADGEHGAAEPGGLLDERLAVVHDQQQPPFAERVDQGVGQRAGRLGLDPEHGGHPGLDQVARHRVGQLDQPGTTGELPASWVATRTASLLLPMPPAPQSVTTRATLSRSASSSTSASRPTKPLGSRGRLPPVREACAVSWVIGS